MKYYAVPPWCPDFGAVSGQTSLYHAPAKSEETAVYCYPYDGEDSDNALLKYYQILSAEGFAPIPPGGIPPYDCDMIAERGGQVVSVSKACGKIVILAGNSR